jgi:hypothetical protein
MRKLLLMITLFFSLNAKSNSIIMEWRCDGLIVSFCENNKMIVGGVEYDIVYCDDKLYLNYNDQTLLYVINESKDVISIVNMDNPSDRKKLTRCYD